MCDRWRAILRKGCPLSLYITGSGRAKAPCLCTRQLWHVVYVFFKTHYVHRDPIRGPMVHRRQPGRIQVIVPPHRLLYTGLSNIMTEQKLPQNQITKDPSSFINQKLRTRSDPKAIHEHKGPAVCNARPTFEAQSS